MAVADRVRSIQRATRPIPRQFGDENEEATKELLRRNLGALTGPIPRYAYDALDDEQLANQIKQRFVAMRIKMAPRIILDMRLLRWFDPQRVQDHWQNVWTGRPLPKMMHPGGLAAGVFNWCKPVIEALTGLLSGFKPMAYSIDVKPRTENSEADRVQSDIVEKWLYREIKDQGYRGTYQDSTTNMVTLGRNWKLVTTDHETKRLRTENLWPGNVAAFWQRDLKTLEAVIIQQDMTPGEAVALYPEKRSQIETAIVGPNATNAFYNITGGFQDPSTWMLYSHVTILTSYYRTMKGKIGCSVVLLNSTNPATGMATVLLERMDDRGDNATKYTDIPARCTARFKTPNKPPDEAQGVLFDLAGLNTEFDEVYSALRDMLWRAIYARYKAKLFSKAPRVAKGSAIFPLPRPGQDIERIDDQVNVGPVETFLTRLEEMIIVFPGLNRYFLGTTPPSETSGDAITASINASITRLEPVRTNIELDELWMYDQWIAQGDAYGEVTDGESGKVIPLSLILEGGGFDIDLQWADVTPKDAIKAKQLAIAALNKRLISRRTAQREWGVLSYQDEDARIARDATNPILDPASVAATAAALLQQLTLDERKKQASAPPPAAKPDVRYSVALSGQLDPMETAAATAAAGIHADASAAAPATAGPAPAPGNEAQAAAARASALARATGKTPVFEDQNGKGGISEAPAPESGEQPGAPAPGE